MLKIAIHSVPRSGSTWLGELINSSKLIDYNHQPLFSYKFKSFLNQNSSKDEIENFFTQLHHHNDDYISQKDERLKGNLPSFVKSHDIQTIAYKEVRYHYLLENMLKKDEEVKLIGLVRNPLEVINSFYLAPREFRKDLGWEIEEEWLNASKKNDNKQEEYFGYAKWKEVTLMFENLKELFPERVKIVKYKDLLNDTTSVVKSIFDFCNVPFEEQTIEFINKSNTHQNNDTYAVYKNKKNFPTRFKLPESVLNDIIFDVEKNNLEKYLDYRELEK